MKLTIVIPAYNEEDAIGSTIHRCLEARSAIIARSPVSVVEIVVVSDGSTDRTAEIASDFSDVTLIEFERNRGYGAAIKEGFRAGSGGIVGFLDADGTCDPNFFADLCKALVKENAAVAIGSRMGPGSKMPWIRRVGNRTYAAILSTLSNKVVSDTASGMRVIRSDTLERLYPLPDGLHFTPAMSARVLMDADLKLVERPMAYEERIGESKLHVWRDGLRFLHTIFHMSLMWRPAKLFHAASITCLVVMVLLALHPLETWVRWGGVEEGMIYRLLFCAVLGSVAVTLLSAGVVADHLHRLVQHRCEPRSYIAAVLDKAFSLPGFFVAVAVCVPLLIWLIGDGISTRVIEGYIAIHWSRVVLAGMLGFGLVQMLATVLVVNIARFHARRAQWLTEAQSNLSQVAEFTNCPADAVLTGATRLGRGMEQPVPSRPVAPSV